MKREPGTAFRLPPRREPGYKLHYRIRIVALVVSIFLVVMEIPLLAKLHQIPYSGVTLNNVTVRRVVGRSPAESAGLKKGDRVVGFGASRCENLRDISVCLSRVRPGDTVIYEVDRSGSLVRVPVVFGRLPLSEVLRKLSLLVVGFSFVAIGLVVYFRRSGKLALVFYLLCFAFGLILVHVASFELGTASHAHRSAINDLLVLSLPALFLHFFLLFPDKNKWFSRHARLEAAIYVPFVVLLVFSLFFNIMLFSYQRTYEAATTAFQTVTALYFITFLLLGLIAFVYAYRHVTTDTKRLRLRLVMWGTILGTLPLIAVHLTLSIKPALEIPGERIAFLPLILVPVAFGHAIVRYGLLDLEIVFKRSLVYTFLIAVLASVYFVVVYGIGRLASRFIGSADLLFSIISIFVITLLISPLRTRIRQAVDKTFFREEYNYRKVLKQISHSLAGMINLESLVSYLCIRVAEVLDASAAVVFLYDDKIDAHTARYAVGLSHTMLKSFSGDGTLVGLLQQTQTTLNVERHLDSRRSLPIASSEVKILLGAKTALVVPFIFKSRLLGFLLIGRKQSDEYYLSTDGELLETLCDQVSLAIENARLYLETLEKQKMEKDLEVAREIQRRLLPKALPEIPGIKSHAINMPSKHVGGDYYDVIPLGPSRAGLVIADVSGKGVPAALLMASLQSSLRAEATPGRQPSQVISALNKVIFEHTAGGTFVTIFYGVLDFDQASLTYCNAGQTPPIVIDKDLGVSLLDETHIVIGITAEAEYGDIVVKIHDGDLLFLYTDGVTDELDEQDEPYGERRLIDTLKGCAGANLAGIAESVHAAIMQYTQGKPQDDITILAIRVQALAARARLRARYNKS